jgi:hypothetical protein
MRNEVQTLIGYFIRGTTFDTNAEVSDMITTTDKIDFETLAERWRVSSRTVRRWHARGIDVTCPVAILEAMTLESSRPKIEAISAALDELSFSENE